MTETYTSYSVTEKTTAWERIREFISGRKRGYQQCFNTPAGHSVLADLAPFCRAYATCFDPDPRVHAALEGRREVWLRIVEHLHIPPEELAAKYGHPKPKET